jgi:predicted RNA methylase
MSLITKIDERFYPGSGRNWDDHIFRQRILSLTNADTEMLDLGAGAGIVDAMNFQGIARRVCGVDLDPRVTDNPFLDEGKVCDANSIPLS